MNPAPVICFGQQPCGFLPRRFLFAKWTAARRLQQEIGGRIVFFFHDSDHDPRETQTLLRNRKTGELHCWNFSFENKLQRKYSPLFLKRVPIAWRDTMARQLPAFADASVAEQLGKVEAQNAADFCLEMYRRMGWIEGMEIVRSSAAEVRLRACEVADFFVDVPYQGEIVRARFESGQLRLHEGGSSYLTLPDVPFTKAQISPSRDTRLRWMQSVVGCTHYVCGAGEQAYLKKADAPEIVFVPRDPIDRFDEAYVPE